MVDIYIENNKNYNIISFPEHLPVFERIAVLNDEELDSRAQNSNLRYQTRVYCFTLVYKGTAKVIINGFSKTVRAGDLICSLPGEVWEWSDVNEVKANFVLFEPDFVLSALKGGFSLEPVTSLNSENHYPFIRLSEKMFKKLESLIEEMRECLEEKPVFYDLLRAQLWQFIFLSEKQYIANGDIGRESITLNHIPTFINLVNRYYRENRDTSFYADKMHITTNYLNKLVKAALGISVRNYIQKRIISEAKVLLRLTNVSVNEICYELGFEDPNYFIRLFKKIEGISPGEYQKKGML